MKTFCKELKEFATKIIILKKKEMIPLTYGSLKKEFIFDIDNSSEDIIVIIVENTEVLLIILVI